MPAVTPPSRAVPLPRYGQSSIADLSPSIAAALGMPDATDVLGLGRHQHVCLLLVDGLGEQALRTHADLTPFLGGMLGTARTLTAGFPATTATSLASLGTGLPPGEHGLVGYVVRADGRLVNLLGWSTYGEQPNRDLRQQLPPERFQPAPTVFARLRDAGLAAAEVVPSFESTGLDRAVFRGAETIRVMSMGDAAATAAAHVRDAGPGLTYVYHGQLDGTAHARGTDSDAWRLQLEHVDRLARHLADRLPSGTLLLVTGDHGMVDVRPDRRVELDDRPELMDGVTMLGGEARARHLYTVAGAQHDVAAAWREALREDAWVVTREQAIGDGWFGPTVAGHVTDRIGDVVVAAAAEVALVQSSVDSIQANLTGHHGSFLPAEQHVPLLTLEI